MTLRPMSDHDGPPRLEHAPLIRVLSQIRWPTFSAFDPQNVITEVGKALATKYPIENKGQQFEILFAPDGPRPHSGEEVYQLSSVDLTWKVTLSKTSVALEASQYPGHQEFIERLGEVVDVLTSAFPIPAWSRMGYRYTNRIIDNDVLDSLKDYFQDQAILGGRNWSQDGMKLMHSVTESVYLLGETTLLVRSASLAPGATVEPMLTPVDTDSWLLDLDASCDGAKAGPLERSEVERRAARLADTARSHFFALISAKFVERFQ